MNSCSPEEIVLIIPLGLHDFPRTRLIPLLRVPGDWDLCRRIYRCPCAEQGTAVEILVSLGSREFEHFATPESTKGRLVFTMALLRGEIISSSPSSVTIYGGQTRTWSTWNFLIRPKLLRMFKPICNYSFQPVHRSLPPAQSLFSASCQAGAPQPKTGLDPGYHQPEGEAQFLSAAAFQASGPSKRPARLGCWRA